MDYKQLANELILRYQEGFPLVERPFAQIAQELNESEENVRQTFLRLFEEGIISRVGPIFATKSVGHSFLAAMKCPPETIEDVAQIINSFDEVNHNYQRENEINLWFVLTGKNEEHLNQVVKEMEQKTGMQVLCFPMIRPYKIDLRAKEAVL